MIRYGILKLFYIEFDPGCTHTSDKHNDNVEETVYVISGKLDMVINGEKVTLSEKQAIRFSANVTHSYQNNYDDFAASTI